MKICFLVSGNGGHLKFFYLVRKLKLINYDYDLIAIADRNCGAIEFARRVKIYSKKIEYDRTYNKMLIDELLRQTPDVIITTWYKILDKEVVRLFRKKLINLHYSLLPAFKGLIGMEPVRLAYEKKCRYIGATTHYVNEKVDDGEIIAQAIQKTNISYSEAVQKIFEKANFILLNSVLIVTQPHLKETLTYNKYWDYSPDLLFDDTVFGATFWEELKRL